MNTIDSICKQTKTFLRLAAETSFFYAVGTTRAGTRGYYGKYFESCLDGQCMIDGSSIEGFTRIEESDMYLRPDLETFAILPWRPQQGKVARLICDVYHPDGSPFEGS